MGWLFAIAKLIGEIAERWVVSQGHGRWWWSKTLSMAYGVGIDQRKYPSLGCRRPPGSAGRMSRCRCRHEDKKIEGKVVIESVVGCRWRVEE